MSGDVGSGRLLLVDDDHAFRRSTAALLGQDGYAVTTAADGSEAVAELGAQDFDLILMDVRMPGIDGIALVEVLRKRGEGAPILMISGFGTVDSAVRALHAGADDFLTKPIEPEVLRSKVEGLLHRRPTLTLPEGDHGIVGRSVGMQRVIEEIGRVGPSDTTVLVTGETGTGKELVARALHRASDRAAAPFVPVNCAALSEGVLESELFGHLKGAFTGALSDKDGLFRAADGGTLFLDEVGDMSPATQQRLLRVLQEREVLPVGGTRPVPVDVRVIAATHRDLKTMVRDGAFREDLFYRLNVFDIALPPLRERTGDIPLLVERFLSPDGAPSEGGPTTSPLAIRMLMSHPWPGNVRQLFGALESARVRAGDGTIQAHHLPDWLRADNEANRSLQGSGVPFPHLDRYRGTGTEDAERDAIVAALEQAGGVRARAAQILGMGRTTLWRKLKQYGLEPED